MNQFPVVVSITSLPSRIGRILPTLTSLLSGARVPNKILLALPPYSIRENAFYVLPEFLSDQNFCREIVEVVAAERDWGPGTKLLGALPAIPNPCYLILADDDVAYKPTFVDGLLRAQASDHASSFSYHTYKIGGLACGQGVDGFSLWSPNVADILPFVRQHVVETDLFYHDDLWISFFLAAKGIPVRSLSHLVGSGMIYEMVHHINALHRLEGSLSRKRVSAKGIKRLLREADMTSGRRFRMRVARIWFEVVERPCRQIFYKLPRRIWTGLRRARPGRGGNR